MFPKMYKNLDHFILLKRSENTPESDVEKSKESKMKQANGFAFNPKSNIKPESFKLPLYNVKHENIYENNENITIKKHVNHNYAFK